MPISEAMTRVILKFGFMESPHVPDGIRQAVAGGKLKDVDPDQISYCIGRETVIASEERPGMAVWREEVFVLMQRNAEETASYFSSRPSAP